MAGLEHALAVAAGDEHQRAVGRGHLVEEHGDVHGPRLGHVVVALPGAVVLVPLPDLAVEGRLGVDLELVHVDRPAEQLVDRPDQPGMARRGAGTARTSVWAAKAVRGAPELSRHTSSPVGGVQIGRPRPAARAASACGEQPGQEQVAVPLDIP